MKNEKFFKDIYLKHLFETKKQQAIQHERTKLPAMAANLGVTEKTYRPLPGDVEPYAGGPVMRSES